VTFPIDEVLQELRPAATVVFGIQYAVDVPYSLAVSGNDGFSGLLALSGQGIIGG
jgi:hypothetical protein